MPMVLSLFLVLGAWRISRHGVLTRRSAAIEALGSATVLCVDKTGTLTQNRMAIEALWAPLVNWQRGLEHSTQVSAGLLEVLRVGVLACEQEPFDPMEKAFPDMRRGTLAALAQDHIGWSVVHTYALSPEQLSVAYVWRTSGNDLLFVAAKGAPKQLAHCAVLTRTLRSHIAKEVAGMAGHGLRVLAIAAGYIPVIAGNDTPWPAAQVDLRLQLPWTCRGYTIRYAPQLPRRSMSVEVQACAL
jgi:Ca2+-transporting ATPase